MESRAQLHRGSSSQVDLVDTRCQRILATSVQSRNRGAVKRWSLTPFFKLRLLLNSLDLYISLTLGFVYCSYL